MKTGAYRAVLGILGATVIGDKEGVEEVVREWRKGAGQEEEEEEEEEPSPGKPSLHQRPPPPAS